MNIDYKVPFFSNTSDDTHCFQAALRMLLKYFYPSEDYTWSELDKITAKEPDMWTWPMAGVLWLKEKGLNVLVQEPFDYQAFYDRGVDYMKEEYGEEVAKAQEKNSDISGEQKRALEYINNIDISKQIPTIKDIKKLLQDGYLPICLVNSKKLSNKEGYVGHFVVVKGFDSNSFLIHDPGLPPHKNRQVGFTEFELAWAYPNKRAKNIIAFRKQE